jgi:hypothetical protein
MRRRAAVNGGMLEALGSRERQALLAHERAHLACGHYGSWPQHTWPRPPARSARWAGRTHPSPGNDSRDGQRREHHAPARRRQNQRFQQAIGYLRGRGRPAVGPGGAPGRHPAMALMSALMLFSGVAQQLLK